MSGRAPQACRRASRARLMPCRAVPAVRPTGVKRAAGNEGWPLVSRLSLGSLVVAIARNQTSKSPPDLALQAREAHGVRLDRWSHRQRSRARAMPLRCKRSSSPADRYSRRSMRGRGCARNRKLRDGAPAKPPASGWASRSNSRPAIAAPPGLTMRVEDGRNAGRVKSQPSCPVRRRPLLVPIDRACVRAARGPPPPAHILPASLPAPSPPPFLPASLLDLHRKPVSHHSRDYISDTVSPRRPPSIAVGSEGGGATADRVHLQQ